MIINSFKGDYFFLSNFSPAFVEFEGDLYPSVEHAYQAAKSLDPLVRGVIRNSGTPGQAKRLGRLVNPIRPDWEEKKVSIMTQLVMKKFNSSLFQKMLLATGDAQLVEGNDWGDRIWGMTFDKDKGWVGQNHLGKILMDCRKYYKSVRDGN